MMTESLAAPSLPENAGRQNSERLSSDHLRAHALWLADISVVTDFDPAKGTGSLQLTVNAGFPGQLVAFTQARIRIFSPRGKAVLKRPVTRKIGISRPPPGQAVCGMEIAIPHVLPWSAESPSLYRVVVEVSGSGDARECTEIWTGFKRVVVDGRRLWINGRPVHLYGANWHSRVPGPAGNREEWEQDVRMLKQNNFNAVLHSRSPNDSCFYELCDRHGLYVLAGEDMAGTDFRHPAEFPGRSPNRNDCFKNHASIVFLPIGKVTGPNYKTALRQRSRGDSTRSQPEGSSPIPSIQAIWHDVIDPVRTMAAALMEFKYMAQPVGVEIASREGPNVTLAITNRQQFATTAHLKGSWHLRRDGQTIRSGIIRLPPLAPGDLCHVDLKLVMPRTGECALNLDFHSKYGTWAVLAGHLVASEQILLGGTCRPMAARPTGIASSSVFSREDFLTIENGELAFSFSKTSGQLVSVALGNHQVFASPLRLKLWRAETGGSRLRHRLECLAVDEKNGVLPGIKAVELIYGTGKSPEFRHTMAAQISRSGHLVTTHHVEALLPGLPEVVRVGLDVSLVPGFEHFSWYGRGPWESCSECSRAARIGVYDSTVAEQGVPGEGPQAQGLHTDTRWLEIASPRTVLRVASDSPFDFAARYQSDALVSPTQHSTDISEGTRTCLYLDHSSSGAGKAGSLTNFQPLTTSARPSYQFTYTWNFRGNLPWDLMLA